MSDITIKFIGREYTIPADVLTYIDLLNFTDSVQKQLVSAFVRKLKSELDKGNVGCLDDKVMAPDIEQQVGKFIAKLTENGIYDRTINDYIRKNEGYKLISKVNAAALDEAKRALKQQMTDWLEGYEDALNKKDASVTGLGFSIWSGSFVNHAIYAAMEASKVNEQEKAAIKEYQKDMTELRSRLENRKNADEQRYIANTYIPHMEAAITVFSYELLDTFISDLIQYGKLSKDVLNYIHIDRSNDLLKNLELSQNKEAVLLKAFEACPYNIAVYMQAMKYDLLDCESFRTAKVFKHGDTIISFLEENLGDSHNSEKKRLNFKNAELLSLYSGRSLREITSYVADFIVNGYAQTIAALTNSTSCYNIMNKVEERDVLAGDSISKQKSAWLVDPLAPAVLWDKLTSEYGHTDLFDRLLSLLPDRPEINSKKEYDDYLKERLFTIFEIIRQERVAAIHAQKQEEARRKEEEAEKAKRTAKRNKKIIILCLIAAAIAIIIAIASAIVTKVNNAKAYQEMAGEFCVYRAINDDGEERNEFNWWLSIDKDGTIKMSSWSYAFDNTVVNSYSGELKNKANFKKFDDYQIEDYCANVSEYEKAVYCYEFHIADEWDEFDGYIVCWQYSNGKIVDVYCDDYRYSFVETSDDYSFDKWESEINSDKLAKNVQKLIDNIDVSEEDVIEEIDNLISRGSYDKAVEVIVTSKLSDEQKNTYYDSLVKKIDFKTFDVNGLVINIPEHWYIEDYSDPYIRSARDSEEDSLLTWYVKCMGTIDQVVRDGDDGWRRDNDYSPTTVAGCEEAYIRRELSKEVDADEVYSVIDYYVVCQGFVYKIQYFAYDERFFEPEMSMLLARVEFTNYAENRAEMQEQKYTQAMELFNERKYEDALLIFTNLDGYKESNQKIIECNNAISEERYNTALALASNSKYKEALALLDELGDYKDAIELSKKYKLVSCESGDVITFGTYEQDGNLINGTEDIVWIVITRDGNKALVISKYCLEQMPFNSTLASVTWKNSTIRAWLNSDFYNNAFSSEERSKIFNTTFSTDGIETTDKVFLLDEEDAGFLPTSIRKADATDYVSTTHCYWFLRNTGSVSNVAYVSYDGELGYYEDVDRNWWVRPVMWIDVSE